MLLPFFPDLHEIAYNFIVDEDSVPFKSYSGDRELIYRTNLQTCP